MKRTLLQDTETYLQKLCSYIPERAVGSKGNRQATAFFRQELVSLGWQTETPKFDTIDWKTKGATLLVENNSLEVHPSPYSLGCSVQAELVSASTIEELKQLNANEKIILLHGALAAEQLMPKNFVFYNPEHHQKIVSLLENSSAKALICATGRNSALAGGLYPFPLIEDGDFDIPSVYMTEEEGARLLKFAGERVTLESQCARISGKSYNVIAAKGKNLSQKIVITAHIDAKKGTPGAIDNATGVIVLLLLARLLKDYNGDTLIELVAFNGEDYYAVPGQMNYIAANQDSFKTIRLNINIDGAGYKEGRSAFSLFDLPEDLLAKTQSVIRQFPGITEGAQWPQGDHSIFLQFGIPAIAISSEWFINNIDTQDITHTPKDNLDIVDCAKLVEIAEGIRELIGRI